MKKIITLVSCLVAGTANAGVISISDYSDHMEFAAATGAVSLTGALPHLGDVGLSVTLGDATLTSASGNISIGSGGSTLLPDGRAFGLSGPENIDVSINTGLASAFGFYFHEPTQDNEFVDGCNAICVDSTFALEFYLNDAFVDATSFSPPDDEVVFKGVILDEAFDEVRFREIVGGHDNEFFGEMYVASAPEPASFILFGLGLFGLGSLRRHRSV